MYIRDMEMEKTSVNKNTYIEGIEGAPLAGKAKSSYTIHSRLNSLYAEYGLKHFSTKFGFTLSGSSSQADIDLGYTQSEEYPARIHMSLDRPVENSVCSLSFSGTTFPLFLRPVETAGDYHLAQVVSDNRAYSCLSVSDQRVRIGFDIFEEIGRFLAGQYDDYFLKQDELGARLRLTPVVDILEELVASALNMLLPRPVKRFLWPDNHKFALVLSHDVDRVFKTFQYLPSVLNAIRKLDLRELFYHINNFLFKRGVRNPYWTFDAICNLEKELGVKSTFYFLNEKGKSNWLNPRSWILYRGVYDVQDPLIYSAIKALSENGCEIGVHGSYNSFNNLDLMECEKKTLESITRRRIKGIRQHYLNYDHQVTPTLHCHCGFNYDSTLGFKPGTGIGFRRGTSFPFQILHPDSGISDLWEIPLIIMDGALDSAVKLEDCLKVIDGVQEYGGVLTILWHNNRLNKREFPQMVDYYIKIVNEAKARDAWIATAEEVYEWLMVSARNL